MNITKILAITFLGTVASVGAHAQAPNTPPPLPAEIIPNVEVLPSDYPASWIMVHDFNFNALIDGRGVVVDTASPERPVKGTVQIAQFGNVLLPSSKPEIYTAGTYYSRLSRGERTDVLTIWDKSTLLPKGEIILPGEPPRYCRRLQLLSRRSHYEQNNEQICTGGSRTCDPYGVGSPEGLSIALGGSSFDIREDRLFATDAA